MRTNNKEDKVTRASLHTPTVNAKGNMHSSGKVEVLAGTSMKSYAAKEMAKMRAVFDQLKAQGVIVEETEGRARFAKTYVFKSANDAASFLLHRGGDNSSAWHSAAEQKPAVKKPVHHQQAEKKKETKAGKPAPAKKQEHAAAKSAPKKQAKKSVQQNKPAAPKHTDKKQTPANQKSASNRKGGASKRKDPRNPRGIRPQGNDAVKEAQKVAAKGYVQFAGMLQGVKVKH